MDDPGIPNKATDKKLTELVLLYQFSNTLLSTIRLNKLTHLILTALTSGTPPLFERAMLFLLNEKSGVLQGMLGVTLSSAADLVVVGGEENPLLSRWDISDEVISRQREAEICSNIKAMRIEVTADCPVIRQVVMENRLYHSDKVDCIECPSCASFRKLGATSFAAVPLLSREKSLGMVVVDNPNSGNKLSMDDLHFLQLFASQAGMAIENSMLYNRIEEAHSNLRDARERLLHGERLAAIGEMAANMAHELKNPLITIGGFSSRLLKVLPPEGREHRYAETIVREVSRLEKMLSDILAYSRKPTICYNLCELREILKECFDGCTTALEDYNVQLSASLGNHPWLLLGDAHQLKQVFLNLLLNACEAMTDGGTITIALEESLDKDLVTISISDTGGGIPVDMLSKIFAPFFTTKPNGTGLGLAIANRIVINHSGTLQVTNGARGAIFTVTLPLLQPEQS
ncbi:GAF domain-containing sensor histidine kinase [Pelotalea chapellei]|uniref:histidine kinase n=1 Tax=Pelotalea chapellei TaxID=44671 RepID=A0ABS5UAJ3_9BACT|nr:GAF domain-containing sensor histidine kinase [Pelotalea chapellei]MBT1072707.1 GAF domain-containing protein [Pelotalea chapellei]